jgi:hypothetical protein
MTNTVVRKWLKANLDKAMRVQTCRLGQEEMLVSPARDVDLVIHIWGGVKIHVHIVDEPIKTRLIKKIVESATSVGIPVLFIVDLKLLPKEGERMTAPPEWLAALHALTGDKIYVYQLKDNVPSLRTARFVPSGRTAELEMQYGDPIGIEQIRYFQRTVRPNFIKGYWMVADFGPDVPPKKDYYKQQQQQAQTKNDFQQRVRQAQPPNQPPRQQTNHHAPPPPKQQTSAPNGHQTNNQQRRANPPPPAKPKTRLEVCYEILGVSGAAQREEVKSAFRKLAFQLHPDVSTLPKAEAEARFKLVSEAYEYIKSANKWP